MNTKRIIFVALILLSLVFSISAQDMMTRIKNYQDNEQWIKGYADIKVAIKSETNKNILKLAYADLAWITMEYGDEKERKGQLDKEAIAQIFAEAEQYGLKSASLGNPKGYFWAAANLGRWAETKGILKSLARAEPMRQYLIKSISKLPNYSNSWDLMGMLYYGLSKQGTGLWNVKFGDINKSISFDRVKFDTTDEIPDFGYLFQMGKHLSGRNFSASQRMSKRAEDIKKYNSIKTLWQKNEYYEGKANYNKPYYWTGNKALKDLSDIQEAKLALNYIISKTNKMINAGTANKGDRRRLKETRVLLSKI